MNIAQQIIEAHKLKFGSLPPLQQCSVSGSALFNADCMDILPLIPDKSVQLILADLPYGTTGCKWDSIIPFEPLWEQYERIIKDDGAIVLFGSQPFTSALIMSNPKLFKYEWVWEKSKTSNYVHCKYQPLKAHENILVFSKYPAAQNSAKKNMVYNPQFTIAEPYNKGKVSNSNGVLTGGRKEMVEVKSLDGKRYPRSVQYFRTAECENQVHPTQKPLALLKFLVATYSNEGEMVLDNVMGSGTCPLAAKELNRKFIGIEKEVKYYELAVGRVFGQHCHNFNTMSSSSKKVRTLQDQASFYLEPVVPGNPRQFWQTMNPERMKQKCFEFLRSDNVNQATKDKLVAIIEQL